MFYIKVKGLTDIQPLILLEIQRICISLRLSMLSYDAGTTAPPTLSELVLDIDLRTGHVLD